MILLSCHEATCETNATDTYVAPYALWRCTSPSGKTERLACTTHAARLEEAGWSYEKIETVEDLAERQIAEERFAGVRMN